MKCGLDRWVSCRRALAVWNLEQSIATNIEHPYQAMYTPNASRNATVHQNTANTPMCENVHKSCVLLNWVPALVYSEHFTNFAPRTNYVCLVCATTRGAIKNFHIKSLSRYLSHVMKNLFMPYANNKGADQPAHPRILISAFVVCC